MELLALFAVGFKGVAAVAGIFLVGGGALGFLYGQKVESKAQAVISKAASAVSNSSADIAKKV